jgi:hypothetical protein
MRYSTVSVLHSADDSDVYKELTVDGVLGAVLRIPTPECPTGHLWRVLRFEDGPGTYALGLIVCCRVEDETSRVSLPWLAVRAMLADGSIITE